MDERAREYVEELVRSVATAGRLAYGRYPIDMTPMASAAGALFALERTGAITTPERQEALARCHAAYGLTAPPDLSAAAGFTAIAYKPEWAPQPPR